MDLMAMHDLAVRAAREGGRMALAALGNPLFQQWKDTRDLLVGSVPPIQDQISSLLRAERPDDVIYAEEGAGDPPPAEGVVWIVDPLDGSLNYYQGIPHFAISIALRVDDIYEIGVVYDPCRNELFHAVRGKFSRLNDEPINVQLVAEGETAYDKAFVGTDWPGGMLQRQQSLNIATVLATQCITLSAMGSPALGFCYVACGRLHAYYHTTLQLWDVAAAAVILSEGGGVLTNIVGNSWRHSDGGYIATNGVIHGWLVRTTKAVLGRST